MALQLLILKMLYLLFTTPGTQEYFYTNDLRVLVDVFVRELNNLSDENESVGAPYCDLLGIIALILLCLAQAYIPSSPISSTHEHSTP